MIILAIKTDQPTAEVLLYRDQKQLSRKSWEAHTKLAETLLSTTQQQLSDQKLTWQDVSGIVCYEGPGSFTGLRIGLSAANALARANQVPIVATTGSNWCRKGIEALLAGGGQELVAPIYGAEPHITTPKGVSKKS